MTGSEGLSLIVRRTIAAPASRLFAAWTEPEHLRRWWGPGEVTCPEAEVDLRVGGRYRIANRTPAGEVIWIRGEFEVIEPPRRLVYSFVIDEDGQPAPPSRVTVRFEERGARLTEVVVVHERIAAARLSASHEKGWAGCLEGLAQYLDEGGPGGERGEP
jgi:uncharacterized protein YndB with AHSA1/START domain